MVDFSEENQDSIFLRTKIIQKIYNQSSFGHKGIARTVEIFKRHYYWPGYTKDVQRYIRNCRDCQKSKSSRQKPNGLLHPLPIPEQRWKNIAMDFVTGFSQSESYNAICTIIDRLTKKRHYVPCYWGDNGTSAESIA